ncbi:unnamed protein product, partial [Strongylus vulgaris]
MKENNIFWINQLEGSPIVFLYGIICTFGALANLVVLFAFIRTSNLRNLRNRVRRADLRHFRKHFRIFSFIVNLACSDLLLCVVTAPVTLYTSANVFWPFGNISCKVVSAKCTTMYSTIMFMLCNAVGIRPSCEYIRVVVNTCFNRYGSSSTYNVSRKMVNNPFFICQRKFPLDICIIRRLAATAPIVCYCIVWIVSIVVALPYSLTVRSSKIDNFEPWNDVHTPA